MISFPNETISVFIHMLTRNENNQVTISGYQRMLSDTVEKYFKPTGQGYDELLEKGMVLVYLSCTTQIFSVPLPSESLKCDMCLSEVSGPIIRFEMQYYHLDGSIAFVSVLYCAVLRVSNRKLERHPEQYLDFNYFNKGNKAIDANSICNYDYEAFEYVGTIDAKASWIDATGHVDNVRYFEIAYDFMSKEQRGRMNEVHRMEVYFIREIIEGQKIVIKKKDSGNAVIVAGFIENNIPAFSLSVSFKE